MGVVPQNLLIVFETILWGLFICGGTGVLRITMHRFGAILCLASLLFLTVYRFPMPPAKEQPVVWSLHCERPFKPIKGSGSAGAAGWLPSLVRSPE